MRKRSIVFFILISLVSFCPSASAADVNVYGNTADNLKAKRDFMVDFAKKMNIADPENATAEYVAGLPVKINGQTVPSEFYTDQQKAAIAAAKSLSSDMQGGTSQTGGTGSGNSTTAGDTSGAGSSGIGSSGTGGSSSGVWSTGSISGFGLPTGTVSTIITTILQWLLAMIGIIGIIGFLIAGAMYILSIGNDDAAKNAKNAMMNSIIGIIVALSGFVIIQAVNAILNSVTDF